MLDKDTVRGWLAEKSGLTASDIADDRRIFTDGLLDSFDLVELVSFVEQQTGKRVRPLDINMRNFDTVAQIADFGGRLVGQ